MPREIFYTFNASAPPADPTVNSTKYVAPLTYANGYYKAIAREEGVITAVTSTSFGMDIVADYWKKYLFDGNANDVNNIETAQLNGTTSYITGLNGHALQTNSMASNYARITMPTGDYTVSIWQFLSGTGTGQPISIANTTGSPTPNFVFTINSNNGITASYSAYMAGSHQSIQTGYDVTVWNNITVSRLGGNQKMYLNGVLIYSTTNTYPQTYLYLGNAFSTYTDTKSFDLVRIYERGLSDAEVTQIYNFEKP